MEEQFMVKCIDLNTGEKITILNGSKRYFETLEEAKKALKRAKWNIQEDNAVKLGNGMYVSVEENLGAKFEWQILKRSITEWEEVNG